MFLLFFFAPSLQSPPFVFSFIIHVLQPYVSAFALTECKIMCVVSLSFLWYLAQLAVCSICRNKRMLAGSVEAEWIWVSVSPEGINWRPVQTVPWPRESEGKVSWTELGNGFTGRFFFLLLKWGSFELFWRLCFYVSCHWSIVAKCSGPGSLHGYRVKQ